MSRKKVAVYSSLIEQHEFRLYDEDLRKLLGLPLRRGVFSEAIFDHGKLLVKFGVATGKCKTKTVLD